MQASNLFFASKKKWDEATFFKEFGPNETELFISSANLRERARKLIPGPIGAVWTSQRLTIIPWLMISLRAL
jgi:hypothetical protein